LGKNPGVSPLLLETVTGLGKTIYSKKLGTKS
jgi:hypothetical protein